MLVLGDSALRKEADAMTFVGCDLHTRTQQVAMLDTDTGEVSEHQLAHEGTAVEEFYAALPGPVTIGIGLIAPAHPILDLGREEMQRQRAWRLVRVDVLAIPLAAPDEELAAGPEGEATLQGDRNRLADHAARERLRRHSSHGAGALLGTRTDGRCSSFLTASDSPGISSADRSARTRRPALRASDGNRARCCASTPGSAPPCTRGSTPSGPVRRSRTTPALDPNSSCSWSSYGCPPRSFSGLRP